MSRRWCPRARDDARRDADDRVAPDGAGDEAVPWAWLGVLGSAACSAASCASRSASSSSSVSWNICRCSAVIASLLAPYFQRLRRVSSKVIFSIFASRQAMSRSLRSSSFCLISRSHPPRLLLDVPEHLRGQRRDGLGRQTLQVLRLEVTHAEHASHLANTPRPHAIGGCPVNARARVRTASARRSHPRDHAHLGQALPGQAHDQGVELALRQRQRRGAASRGHAK